MRTQALVTTTERGYINCAKYQLIFISILLLKIFDTKVELLEILLCIEGNKRKFAYILPQELCFI